MKKLLFQLLKILLFILMLPFLILKVARENFFPKKTKPTTPPPPGADFLQIN